MTLIRRRENLPLWAGVFNDIFRDDIGSWLPRNYSNENATLPSVNMKESDDAFELEMAAPGMKREDFEIKLDKGVLSISSEKREESSQEESDNYTRREFSYQAFCRSFSLPTSADIDKIGAKYVDGILTINIPKLEEAKPKPIRLIDIK
ncbi:MAG: Hsp20/alpha crystallin family protein [Bacteroidales bacterium]